MVGVRCPDDRPERRLSAAPRGPAAGTAATDSTTAVVGDGTLGQVSASDAEVHSTRDRGEARLAHLVLYPGHGQPSTSATSTSSSRRPPRRHHRRRVGGRDPCRRRAVAAGTRITVPGGTGTFVLNDQQTGPGP